MGEESYDLQDGGAGGGGTLRRRLSPLWKWRRYIIIFATPLLLLPLPLLAPEKKFKCAYAVLVMGVFWVTEVCPLAVTSFLPMVLFPMLGVLESNKATKPYFKDTNALFLGGLIVAVAIETVNLHKRIALKVLLLVGAQPRRLMLGFMLTTAFLSMWISNTATTAMMLPIMQAVLAELKQDQVRRHNVDDDEAEENLGAHNKLMEDHEVEMEAVTKDADRVEENGDMLPSESRANLTQPTLDPKAERKFTNMHKCLILSVAYAANVGGTGTLMGTGPNLVMNGLSETLFPDGPGIGFIYWSMFTIPITLVLLISAWILLQFIWMGIGVKHLMCFCRVFSKRSGRSQRQIQVVRRVIEDQYKALGPMRFNEKVVLVHFVILVFLWLFRDPKFIPGWASAFPANYVKDAQPALLVAFMLFIMPAERPVGSDPEAPRTILTWDYLCKKFPWGLVLLMGSGFAMADACKESGLSAWVGGQMTALSAIPPWCIVLVCCALITFFTEFTSNTATATIFLPILGQLAVNLKIHPWYIMLPCTISASFAFMLPVATPPNAIVFSSGEVKITDMFKSGLWMNLLCIIVLVAMVNTYNLLVFDLGTFPAWAGHSSVNGTAV